MKSLKLSLIRTDAGTQTRCEIHSETVNEYAEAMGDGAKFPAVVVFHDGKEYFLADGFHRVRAADSIGAKDILADVRKGGKEDALKFSLGANDLHGLRRSNADKRNCVRIALENFANLSDGAVAKICGVSDQLVRNLRPATTNIGSSQRRIGIDGKERPVKRKSKSKPSPTAESEPEEKPHIKTADEELAQPEPDDYRPSKGMEYAMMAVVDLGKINKRDTQREEAFNYVTNWIKQNR